MKIEEIPEKEFKKIYSKVPRLCVDIAIKTKDGVLLTKRAVEPYKGMWHLPGGTVLKGETLNEAVRRIGQKELGIGIEPIQIISVLEYDPKVSFDQSISIVYLCLIKDLNIRLDDDASDVNFFEKIPANTVPTVSALLKSNFNLSE